MSDGGAIWRSFADLDTAADVSESLGYLGDMRTVDAVTRGKRRAIGLLGLSPGARVLDVGCGDGLDTVAMAAEVAPDGAAVGIDASAAAVALAAGHAQRLGVAASFSQGDAAALGFESASFDATLCDRTLQHVADPVGALRELARVVRPGGAIVVSESLVDVEAVPGIDPTAARRVVSGLTAAGTGQAWMGLMAPLVFKRAGVELACVDEVPGTVKDAEGIFIVCGLDRFGRPRSDRTAPPEEDVAAFCELVRENAGLRLWARMRTAIFLGRAT